MSNTNTETKMYAFQGYDPKAVYPDPATNHRMVKVQYKGGKQGAYVVIPEFIDTNTILDHFEELSEYLVQYLAEVQDSKIKEYHRKGGTSFGEQFLSVGNLIQYLEDTGRGQRLSSEGILEWYKQEGMSDAVLAHYTEVRKDIAPQIAEAIGEKLAELAGNKTLWTENDLEKMVKVLIAFGPEQSAMYRKLASRMDSMIQRIEKNKQNNLMNALGI